MCGYVQIKSFGRYTKDEVHTVKKFKEEKNNIDRVTLMNISEYNYELVQGVTNRSRKETHPDTISIFHTLATKACVISTKSGLTCQR